MDAQVPINAALDAALETNSPADLAALTDMLLDAPTEDRLRTVTALVHLARRLKQIATYNDHHLSQRAQQFQAEASIPERDTSPLEMERARREQREAMLHKLGETGTGYWYAFRVRRREHAEGTGYGMFGYGPRMVLRTTLEVVPLDGGATLPEGPK